MTLLPVAVLAAFMLMTGSAYGHGSTPPMPPPDPAPAPTTPPAQTGPIGQDLGTFSAACTFSHRAVADPIVFPGQPGAGHSHDFLGARVTDAFTTAENLRASPTTCARFNSAAGFDAARSAYWVPTLYVNDKPVAPGVSTINYTAGRRYFKAIRPFAPGHRMVVGNATGPNPQEVNGERVWFYECKGATIRNTEPVPTCADTLVLTMRFADCSNGALDSPDHKAHMAFSRRPDGQQAYVCPPSHPFLRPKLALHLRYPTKAGSTTRLASGGPTSAHADFFNGWLPGVQEGLVTNCLNVDRYCGGGDTPDA